MDKVKTGIKVTTFFLSFYLFLNLAYSHAVKSDEEKQNKGLISRTRGAVKNFINNTEFVEQQGNLDAFSVAISGPGGLVRETDKDIELKTHQRFLRKMVDAHPKAERYVKQQFNISYKEVINEENENLRWAKNNVKNTSKAAVNTAKNAAATYFLLKGAEKAVEKSSWCPCCNIM